MARPAMQAIPTSTRLCPPSASGAPGIPRSDMPQSCRLGASAIGVGRPTPEVPGVHVRQELWPGHVLPQCACWPAPAPAACDAWPPSAGRCRGPIDCGLVFHAGLLACTLTLNQGFCNGSALIRQCGEVVARRDCAIGRRPIGARRTQYWLPIRVIMCGKVARQ